MTSRLLFQPEKKQAPVQPNQPGGPHRILIPVIIGVAGLLLLGLLAVPVLVGTNLFFAAGAGCSGQQTGAVGQPTAGPKAKAIPADYLYWYKKVGQQYGVPWTILAGIGTVESDNGQTTLPGVHSGSNAFGAAGPMQIGIGGAAGNVWGGLPVHPASEVVSGVATDEDGGPERQRLRSAGRDRGRGQVPARVRCPDQPVGGHLRLQPPAVLRAERALLRRRVRGRPLLGGLGPDAVGQFGGRVHRHGRRVAGGVPAISAPNQLVAAAIAYTEQQLGKPYLFGGTGPDAFDCSGLVMMAYRSAGVNIERTSEQQWATEVRVPASQAQPGDLVFFAGADGTPTSPGHVGLVIGGGKMIEAYATGFPIRVATYANRDPIGFTRPWANANVTVTSLTGT